jgi:hypothetical protein
VQTKGKQKSVQIVELATSVKCLKLESNNFYLKGKIVSADEQFVPSKENFTNFCLAKEKNGQLCPSPTIT